MDQTIYTAQWPEDQLYVECFAHQVNNYRFHWHQNDYEVSVIVNGRLEHHNGLENGIMETGDISILIPGEGHASFARSPDTRGLVLHFSASAFNAYLKKGHYYTFSDTHSNSLTRNEERFRLLRMYLAQLYDALSGDSPFRMMTAKAAVEMIMVTLCTHFSPKEVERPAGLAEDMRHMQAIVDYIEEHYTEKITLEDLATHFKYNRTYISTLFKESVGVNFHRYLTRLRFQHALLDMTSSDRSLIDIAVANGFSDIKGFRKQFQDAFGMSPSEFRDRLSFGRSFENRGDWHYISSSDDIVHQRIQEFMHIGQ
ncbi:MAG: helix-turn-helix transcriptional regulator [Solobacterium sp.]|nr:helix-turn-helix transcriptional regulator [Solobacterium sp.]